MSNIYLLEPHTNGKVILHTSYGDISIELWSKEAPKACRNFVQLCMEGYYNDTIFHRIVAGFIIQGGDPEGTGLGGESSFEGGKPFPDEFHSRLRFVRRGLVAMANSGAPNDNKSQFFITLDATMELQNKHTIFGKIAGDTIFNVLKIGGLEVDANERPLYPPKVINCTIVVNPFEDIVPRISRQEREAALLKELEAQKKPEKQKKLKKNVALLSFADDAPDLTMDEENQDEAGGAKEKKKKMLSSHDLLEDDPTLSRETDHSLLSDERPSKRKVAEETDATTSGAREVRSESAHSSREPRQQDDDDDQESVNAFNDRMRDQVRERQKKARLAKEEASSSTNTETTSAAPSTIISTTATPLSDGERLEREQYRTRAESNSTDKRSKKSSKSGVNPDKERELLEKLSAFEAKVFSSAKEPEPNPAPKKNDAPPCQIHGIPSCESCQDTTASKRKKTTRTGNGQDNENDENGDEVLEDDDSDNDIGWMQHKLVFEKDLKGKDVSLSSKRDDVNDYIVIDPLNKAASTIAAMEIEKQKKVDKIKRNSQFSHRDSNNNHKDRRSHNTGASSTADHSSRHDRPYERSSRDSSSSTYRRDDDRRSGYSRDARRDRDDHRGSRDSKDKRDDRDQRDSRDRGRRW
ncbi:Peptidyl-prolyl isomerase cwc27 [Mortierella alpina]|uniref:Peptidyl-prolyl isomerase CWC27 n=1 Tax=Mortierella alpina TaxID=64518 RepID=A0A9P6J9A7_MORAP|nr:Peptidyl-prolyl isomerase cwc27 [Mortierella alpina]